MRLSRPCYDKPWRCPGWAGGGMRYAKRDRCEGGRMLGWNHGEQRWPHLWFHRCNTCDVVTLPFALRWVISVDWWGVVTRRAAWRLESWWLDVRERWGNRR